MFLFNRISRVKFNVRERGFYSWLYITLSVLNKVQALITYRIRRVFGRLINAPLTVNTIVNTFVVNVNVIKNIVFF